MIVPKIAPIGTKRRNDLFHKKFIYFIFILQKTSTIEQIKPHFFYPFFQEAKIAKKMLIFMKNKAKS